MRVDPVLKLAANHGIVLLNGTGFDAPAGPVRVSFANLPEQVDDDIGRALRSMAAGDVAAEEASTKEKSVQAR